MSLIEQAAQRLAQLRQAGVDMPPQSEERVVAPTKDEPVRSLRDDEPPPTSKRGDQEALPVAYTHLDVYKRQVSRMQVVDALRQGA